MVPNSIVELINLLPSRNNGNGEEAVRVLQREEYVDGSSDLGPGLAGNGLESTLNRLVGNEHEFQFVCCYHFIFFKVFLVGMMLIG